MSSPRRLLVACLCAEWCGSCREYRETFASLTEQFAAQVDFVWVDIEDDDEVVGSLDVENFPTLLIADGQRLLFLGPVTPQPSTAQRLLRGALAGELAELSLPGAGDLATRIRRFGAS